MFGRGSDIVDTVHFPGEPTDRIEELLREIQTAEERLAELRAKLARLVVKELPTK